jgi:hypothetical protein
VRQKTCGYSLSEEHYDCKTSSHFTAPKGGLDLLAIDKVFNFLPIIGSGMKVCIE